MATKRKTIGGSADPERSAAMKGNQNAKGGPGGSLKTAGKVIGMGAAAGAGVMGAALAKGTVRAIAGKTPHVLGVGAGVGVAAALAGYGTYKAGKYVASKISKRKAK